MFRELERIEQLCNVGTCGGDLFRLMITSACHSRVLLVVHVLLSNQWLMGGQGCDIRALLVEEFKF